MPEDVDVGAALSEAEHLLRSRLPDERSAGWEVIEHLCNGQPENVAAGWAVARRHFLTEADVTVLPAAIYAIRFMTSEEIRDVACMLVLPHANSTSTPVRLAVAQSIPLITGAQALPAEVQVLLQLMDDEDGEVRNWATHGLGQRSDVDTTEVRGALVARLDDEHFDARHEALFGLAVLHDERALAATLRELTNDTVGRLAVYVAALIGDDRLLSALVELRTWWDLDSELLMEAIRRCSPGDDAVDLGRFNDYGEYLLFHFLGR